MPDRGETMRSIICIVIMFALIGLTGCAKKEAAPVEQPAIETETTVIATEDFESGEAEIVVEEVEEVADEAPDGGDH
jgi:PBP1b-binding outer membrane lipoprotein LpoB